MEWDGNQLTEATVTSTIGGNLRLRSYVPLEGEGLKTASGENPNPLLQAAAIKAPLVSRELENPQQPLLYRLYEYDVPTRPGQTYTFRRISPVARR